MPDPNITRVNNVPYSWTSLGHFFNSLPYRGVTSVSLKDSREIEIVHAAQHDGTPLGMTAGIYKAEQCTFELLADTGFSLLSDLTLLGLGSYGDAEFPYMMQYFEPTLPGVSLPQQTLLSSCRITGVEEKAQVGSGKAVVSLTVQPKYIIRTYSGVPLRLWSAVRAFL